MNLKIPHYLKPLRTMLTIAFYVGLAFVTAIGLYVIVIPIYSRGLQLPLIMLINDGIRLNIELQATHIGMYVLYSLLLITTLSVGLYFLYSLRKMATTLMKKAGFAQELSAGIRTMALCLIVLTYLKQILLFLALRQLPSDYQHLLSFTFRIIPEQVIYAISLLVLSRLFSYALALQKEYEQTV